MWFSSLVTALLGSLTIGCATAEAAIECPEYHNGEKLIGVNLSEGPPSEKRFKIPIDGIWNVDRIPDSGKMFYLG